MMSICVVGLTKRAPEFVQVAEMSNSNKYNETPSTKRVAQGRAVGGRIRLRPRDCVHEIDLDRKLLAWLLPPSLCGPADIRRHNGTR